jgi:hypothetical protein
MDTFEVSLNQIMDVDITKNLEFWMTNLPQKLRTTPIIYLSIPGSHDSMTYDISEKSRVAPDAEPVIQKLKFLGPFLTAIMVKWSKTQLVTPTEQLCNGIRYFDLRIATKKHDAQFYFVHGLYSSEVSKVLEEVKVFLDTHPKEVVILDCQHFYAFQQCDHERLMYLLRSTFGHKLLPYMPHMEHISLQYMTTECHYQVVAIYRSDAARFGQPLLWPSACFPTPWANTDSVSKLIAFLVDKLQNRNNLVGFISQCVLTPTPWFIFKHLLSCLKNQCLVPLEKEKYKWLKNQRPGPDGVNIVISDFVDYDDGTFSKAVIGLNRKLLDGACSNEFGSAVTPVDRIY